MRPLIALCAMFKNEAGSARAVLESARPHVDQWLVVDTGSTDGTQDIVREVMAGVPGALVEASPILHKLRRGGEVFDFGSNRNRVLHFAERGTGVEPPSGHRIDARPVFTLFLSGDETLIGGDKLRAFLEERREAQDGAYSVRLESGGSRVFGYTRILRVDAGWLYKRVVHEVPESPEGDREAREYVPGVVIRHAPPETDAERKMARIRGLDLPVLEEEVEDESVPVEKRVDAIRMLGETHAQLASETKKLGLTGPWVQHQLAAMGCFFRYATIAGESDPEMAHYVLALYYHLAGEDAPETRTPLFYTHAELFERLKTFVAAAPDEPHARFLLAKHAALSDPRLGLPHAKEAAKAAKAALTTPRRVPVDSSLVWRSLILAATCVDALRAASKAKEEQVMRASQVRKLVDLAAKEGAPEIVLGAMRTEKQAQEIQEG